MNGKMLLYFAAPLFNANELAFNARLSDAIEQLGYDVFLPQRDAGYDTIAETVFNLDWNNVRECDVLLGVLDGRVPDEGVAVEIGLGYADRVHHKPELHLIGYTTQDFHVFGEGLNPMLSGALDEVYSNEDSLLERLSVIAEAAWRRDGFGVVVLSLSLEDLFVPKALAGDRKTSGSVGPWGC
jgi:nucleoside 2-deoxyribosyltransferase